MEISQLVSKADLLELKKDLVAEIKSLNPGGAEKKFLRSKQVEELLGISSSSLQNFRIKGIIPFKKVGGTLFYNVDRIKEVLEN